MNENILNHYIQVGVFTNPGCYREFLQNLPDDIEELGTLVCHQVIHRMILSQGNTGMNTDKRYGAMEEFPWFRLRCDDDVLTTAVSMIAELLRLDPDKNFNELKDIWNTKKKFRILNSPLIGDDSHVKWR